MLERYKLLLLRDVMETKNYRKNLITTSFLALIMIGVSIPTKTLAKTNPLKGCDTYNGIPEENSLKEIPGYPSKNPEKTLYRELPYRVSAGAFIIIMRDGKLCTIVDSSNETKDKARAIKKFSEIYPRSKPVRICEFPQTRVRMTCKRL
jgi:hypothetical protein